MNLDKLSDVFICTIMCSAGLLLILCCLFVSTLLIQGIYHLVIDGNITYLMAKA